MSATVQSPPVREPKPAPAEVSSAAAAPASFGPAVPEPAVFWGDRFAARLWITGAGILALLHIVEWVYRAVRP